MRTVWKSADGDDNNKIKIIRLFIMCVESTAAGQLQKEHNVDTIHFISNKEKKWEQPQGQLRNSTVAKLLRLPYTAKKDMKVKN
jgi:hypothetical protein